MTITVSNYAQGACSFFVQLAVLFTLGGCAHAEDENEASLHATLGVESVFTTGVTAAVATKAVGTRTESIKVTSGKLRVGIRSDNGYTAMDGASGPTFQCTDGIWTLTATDAAKNIGLNAQSVSLYAYYPQDKFTIIGDDISFTTRAYSDDDDLCYATSGGTAVTALSPRAVFQLQHVYARIRLSLTRTATFTGTGTISLFRLKPISGSINLDGTVNINTGVGSSFNASSDGFTYNPNTTVAVGTANTDCDILIPEQTIPTDGFTVTLLVDGNARSMTIPRSKFGTQTTLKANSLYTIETMIEYDGILSVNNAISEEGWVEPTTGDFGNIDDYN